jgi:hypothetical protein
MDKTPLFSRFARERAPRGRAWSGPNALCIAFALSVAACSSMETFRTSATLQSASDDAPAFRMGHADVTLYDCVAQPLAVDIGPTCELLADRRRDGVFAFRPGTMCTVNIDGSTQTLRITDGHGSLDSRTGLLDLQVGGDRPRARSGSHVTLELSGERASSQSATTACNARAPGSMPRTY